jgi:hypothetical protein
MQTADGRRVASRTPSDIERGLFFIETPDGPLDVRTDDPLAKTLG